LGAALGAATIGSTSCEPAPGKLRETSQVANGSFRVRVDVYDDRYGKATSSRCHVRLLTAPVGSDEWRQFGNAFFEHCEPDLRSRVRFVNEQVAYVYLQWRYTVTTDGGRNWTTWSVPDRLKGVFYNQRLIEHVVIRPDGTGTMTLNPEGVAAKQRVTLETQNFGRDWTRIG
jgi:hypothetical protein